MLRQAKQKTSRGWQWQHQQLQMAFPASLID